MGKLLEQIKTRPLNTGGVKSSVDLLLEKMKDQDRKDLLEALSDSTIPPTVIVSVLESNGMKIGRSAILRWRTREGV